VIYKPILRLNHSADRIVLTLNTIFAKLGGSIKAQK
jgi:hypothetical protein